MRPHCAAAYSEFKVEAVQYTIGCKEDIISFVSLIFAKSDNAISALKGHETDYESGTQLGAK